MNVIGYYLFSLTWPNNSHLIKSWLINQKGNKEYYHNIVHILQGDIMIGRSSFLYAAISFNTKERDNVFIFRLRSTQTFWPRALFQDVFPFSKPNFNIKYFSIKYSFWKYDGCVFFKNLWMFEDDCYIFLYFSRMGLSNIYQCFLLRN